MNIHSTRSRLDKAKDIVQETAEVSSLFIISDHGQYAVAIKMDPKSTVVTPGANQFAD
jgi:hypothetical protein